MPQGLDGEETAAAAAAKGIEIAITATIRQSRGREPRREKNGEKKLKICV